MKYPGLEATLDRKESPDGRFKSLPKNLLLLSKHQTDLALAAQIANNSSLNLISCASLEAGTAMLARDPGAYVGFIDISSEMNLHSFLYQTGGNLNGTEQLIDKNLIHYITPQPPLAVTALKRGQFLGNILRRPEEDLDSAASTYG
ncbi:MAG: hypothetical protein EOP06_26330, partial [Proteobacteria bacterium]